MPTRKRERRGLREVVAALALITSSLAALPADAGAQAATKFKSSDRVVRAQERVTLRGTLPPPVARQTTAAAGGAQPTGPLPRKRVRAQLQFRAVGAAHWQSRRSFRTAKDGRFLQRIKPSRSGRFRVRTAHGVTTRPIAVTVRARVNGEVSRHVKVGRKARVRGRVFPANRGRPVVIRAGSKTVRTKTRRDGRFSARFKAKSAGTTRVKIRAKGNRIATGARTRAGKLTVLRPAFASYFGPGFYGGPLACGGRLGTGTIGVAHKSLPCGTKLTVRHGGRSLRVKVIDRGPFIPGREFDLTAATKRKLGFGDLGTIWVDR